MINKSNYFEHFWSRRLKKVYLPMVLINILYIIWYYFVDKEYAVDWRRMIKGLLGIELIVGTEWYIITLFIFYVLFYILFKSLKAHRALLFFFISTIIYAYICNKLKMDIKWYKSCFAFPMGLAFGIYGDIIFTWLKRYYKVFSILSVSALMALIVMFCVAFRQGIDTYNCYMIFLQICISILFVSSYLVLTMKVIIDNCVLSMLGRVSYELYLIHYLFIEIFRGNIFYIKSDLEYFGTAIICSIIFSIIYKKINEKLMLKIYE